MAIEFTCKAGHKLRVPDELAGKKVRCPKCSERLVVPEVERKRVDVSDSDVRAVEPPSRSGAGPPVPAQSAQLRPSTSPPSLKAGVSSRDSNRQEPAAAASNLPWPKWIWLMLAGFGAAAMLLIGMGMFVAYKLFSPQNAVLQTVAQNPASQRESAEPIGPPSKRAATPETAAAASPAKTSPAVANSTIEKPAQRDATDSSPPSTSAPSTGRSRQTVQLPAPMEQLVVGGSGNYLVAALP